MLILKSKHKLFKLVNEAGQIVPFTPNKVQWQVINEIERQLTETGKARLIVIKGRQQGITTLMQLLALSYVMTEPAYNAYTMAHDASIANDIFEKKIKFAFDNLHPTIKSIYKAKRDNTRQLMFEGELNSSNITVGLSARSTTQNFLHISEAGKMSMNKNLWDEMTQGSLPAAEQAKIIVIESTPDGGQGKFYDMVQASLRGENEFKTLFLSWTDSDKYQETPPENDDWVEKYKTQALAYSLPVNPIESHGLTKAQLYWYYKKLGTLGSTIKSQYPLDIEQAFDQYAEGAYYQKEIDLMVEEGRFSDNSTFAYNPIKTVRTWWDLAVSHDLNAIIIAQIDGGYINIIDYYENTGVSASVIANDLMQKGYLFSHHYAPHDVNTKQIGETALRSKKDIYASVGINFTPLGKSSVASGIEAVRLLFPRLRIHKNHNTILLLNRLKAYRSEDKQGLGVSTEVHDINSHAADALRYLAVSVRLNESEFFTQQKATIKSVKPVKQRV